MKDAFERRALLLHLGDALHAIEAALAADVQRHTLRDLLNVHGNLAAQAWLAAVAPDMTAAEFAKRASASFAGWPALLLAEHVDYTRLALDVRDRLFADDPAGWRAYADAIRREVEWFGDALPAANERAQASEEGSDEADSATPEAADIERADESVATRRESVESGESGDDKGRLYPSWPWKPGV
ncbi:hypothetical protein H3V53_33485 [Paraburkholderia bengalensis]|uniref:Uncharacterized protein n=1 Tax=Paraburkholderia bengalensis TaxID=2747562 RepID=A0ABU8J1U0_9BURK